MNEHQLRRISAGILIVGFLLPSVIALIVMLILEPTEVARLFASSAMTFILIGLFNAIPFAVYVKILKSTIGIAQNNLLNDGQLKHKYGLIFAAIAGLSVIVFVQINTWIGMIKLAPGASTTGIAFLYLPVYGVIAILLGYGFGVLIVKMQTLIFKR